MQTLTIYKLGFNQDYYTFTFISLIKIVLCSKFPLTKFIYHFDMRLGLVARGDGKKRLVA